MPSHVVLKNRVSTVPREKQSAAYRLFFNHRRVLVQQIFTMNARTMGEVGIPTSGNEKVDRDLRTEWVTIQLTPVEMTQYIQRGARLMFENPEAATRLYLDLVEHLKNWLDVFDTNPNLRRAPIDELRLFDELAGEVFKYASRRLMPDEEASGYGAWLAQMSRFRRGITTQVLSETPTSHGAPTYRSYSDQIAERLAKRLERRG
jgi:hypothetical protein